MHSATSAFYDDNAPFRSRYLDSRYHDAYRLHRLHCVATARAVGDLLSQIDCDAIGTWCFIEKLHKCIFNLYIYLQFTIYNLQIELQITTATAAIQQWRWRWCHTSSCTVILTLIAVCVCRYCTSIDGNGSY